MTKPIRNYYKRKPPTEGTCKACVHFSQGYRMIVNGYCMKHRSSTKSGSTCAFYRSITKYSAYGNRDNMGTGGQQSQ